MRSDALRTLAALMPLGGLLVFFFASMVAFAARCRFVGRPRTPYIETRHASRPWKWLMEWWIWLWSPIERGCLRLGISPDAITLVSIGITAAAAALLAIGYLSIGGWTYLFAASLDIVDGRVARATGTSSKAGAFLDSTLDRVGEILVFSGLAVYFRTTPALLAALGAAGASIIVSYARARGEALGATDEAARSGGMQRAERVVLTGVPCALAPLCDAAFGDGSGGFVAGSALALLAFVTSVTAVRRSYAIWRALRGLAGEPRPLATVRWLETSRRRGHSSR